MASEDVFRRRAFVPCVPCAESPDLLTCDHGIGEAQQVNGRQLGSIGHTPRHVGSQDGIPRDRAGKGPSDVVPALFPAGHLRQRVSSEEIVVQQGDDS